MCNVSITCLLVCSPHSARLRDSLKTACKNVIFQHHTVKGCFAKPVFSCTRVPSHLCVPPLSFFSHVYTQLMTWRCLIRCCAVFHIVVISRNHPLTHSLQNIYIQTPFAVAENFMLQHVQTNHEGFYPDGCTGWSGVQLNLPNCPAHPESPITNITSQSWSI